MKQILIILSVLTLLSCQKQRDTYLITGNIQGIPDSTIIDLYIQYDNMGERVSSDTIINGHFEFSDTLDTRPSKMNLVMQDWNNYFGSCDLWVDHEVIEITGSGKYLSAWLATGNNNELKALNRLKSPTRDIYVMSDSLYLLRVKNRRDRELSDKLGRSIDSIRQIGYKIEIALIEEDPNSQSALELLYYIAKFDSTLSKNKLKTIYEKLDTNYQNSLYGEGILTTIENKPTPEIGDKMVDFIASDIEGDKHHLSSFEGKYILLDFWALGCGPCIKAIPETKELYTNNKDILTVVGVSMDTKMDAWREISKKDSINWVNLSDGKGSFAGVSADYGIQGFPTYILINPEGVIIEKWMGYWPEVFKQKLETHIEDLKI